VILKIAPNVSKDTSLYWVKRSLKLLPEDFSTLYQSAKIADYFDQDVLAKKLYRKLITLAPDSLIIKANYASLLLRTGEVDSALLYYEEVYDSLRGNYRVELGFARALEKKGRIEEALNHYISAQNKRPGNINLLIKIAQLYLQLNSPDEALKVLQGSDLISLFNPTVLQLRGIALYRLNEPYKAAKDLLMAYSLDPTEPEIPYYLSRIFYQLGDKERALEFIERALKIDKKRDDFRIYKSFLLVSMDRVEEAIKVLKRVKRKDPYVYSVKGHAYRMAGDLKKAEEFFRKALDMDTTSPQRYVDLSSILYDRGNREEAHQILLKAKEKFPNNTDILFRLAEMASLEGEIDRAVQYYRELAEIDSTNSTVYNNWGYLLAKEGKDLDLAEKLIDKALSMEPDNPIFLDSKGWVYYQRKDYKKALEYIKRAISMGVEDSEVFEHLGDIYEKLGEIEKAIHYWKKALDLNPDNEKLKERIRRFEN
jgi:tetratricopeptide (TPR) repeat protein